MEYELNPREVMLFHKNFQYMWRKLNTSYYVVKSQLSKRSALNIEGADFLPAYRICSQINNNPNYVPTKHILDGIVNFYNANIQPPVDSIQFIRENLEDTNEIRFKSDKIHNEVFIGTYFGHYKSASDGEEIIAAFFSLYEEYNTMRASIIMGIRNDDALCDEELLSIFRVPDETNLSLSTIYQQRYNSYIANQDKNNQRASFYQGNVEITPKSMNIHFYEYTGDHKKMTISLNLVSFPSGRELCNGGMAYVLRSSDGSYDTRFFKMGVTNRVNGCLSLEDPRVKKLLKLRPSDYEVVLTSAEDRSWYELILESLKDKKLLIPAESRF